MTPPEHGKDGLPVRHFPDREALEAFVASASDRAGFWLKLAKANSGIASVTRQEAVDVGLCHGWIDGQLAKWDDRHWLIRFTPRRARSRWSAVNVRRAGELLAEGRVAPPGRAEIDAAKADGRWAAAYEPSSRMAVPEDLAAALAADPKASAAFAALGRTNRYAILYRIGTAKREETRRRKIADYVAMLARGETIHLVKAGKTRDTGASGPADDQ